MRFPTLHEWLAWQETSHVKQIDLGLERTRPLLQRMGLGQPTHAVITVAGTNGKGSSVALLEAILLAAGYRVGSYSSPHLVRYNERIRIQGSELDDQAICAAFARIDQARGATSLSYFEFGTLAAFDLFARARLDVAVLEVGMGGRLDTVNLIDADVALITSVGIDHVEYLGPDREAIGREKAGIFRPARPAVCADPEPPASVVAYAAQLGSPLYCLGRDFGYAAHPDGWSWWARRASETTRYEQLPSPALEGAFQLQNAAGVLMALAQLEARLPLNREAIVNGLRGVNLAGRFQVIPGTITRILDVAHNPHGAQVLAQSLQSHPCQGRTRAVFAMLADKDIVGVLQCMRQTIDAWYVAGLTGPRASTGAAIVRCLQSLGVAQAQGYDTVAEAYQAAMQASQAGDRVIVFGSFHTVAQVMQIL